MLQQIQYRVFKVVLSVYEQYYDSLQQSSKVFIYQKCFPTLICEVVNSFNSVKREFMRLLFNFKNRKYIISS